MTQRNLVTSPRIQTLVREASRREDSLTLRYPWGKSKIQNPKSKIEMTIPSRTLWIKGLTAHSPQKLQSLAEDLTSSWQVNHKSLPQAGLSLLQMEDGVFHEPYYLGEIPVASAWIELTTSNDESFEGAAQVMSDSAELAVVLAVCDAVMAHQLPGWEKVAVLIEKGLEKRAWEELQRGAMLAKTKVNFSLLSQEEDNAED